MDIMSRRSTLKGSGVTIADDLCKDLHRLMNTTRDSPLVSQTFVWDSKVFVKGVNGRIRQIRWGQTVEDALAQSGQNKSD